MNKVVYIKNLSNLGVARAWNQGIKIALNLGSNLLLVTNNDIVFDPDCIDLLIERVRKTHGMVSANHNEKCAGEDHQMFWSCFVYHKDVIGKMGYFDENFFPARGEDEDAYWRASIYEIDKGRLFNAKVIHENNGTGKNLKEGDPFKDYNWAGALGENITYLRKKQRNWGY